MLKSISPLELKQKLAAQEELLLVDVRDSFEFEEGHLPAINIPMAEMFDNLDKLQKDKPVVFYCRTGLRGKALVYMLSKMYAYENLINLEGGYEAYHSLN